MPAMICDNCKTETPDDAIYCPHCGDRLDRRMQPDDEPEVDKTAPMSSDITSAARNAGQPGGADRLRDTVRKNGSDDEAEEERWQGGYSGKAMIGSWLGAGLISLLLLVAMIAFSDLRSSGIAWGVFVVVLAILWLALAALLIYRRLDVHYQLTTQRLIHRSGVLRRRTDRIEVIDIDDVTYEQGLVERFIGVGTIKITSSDRSDPELNLYGIDEVAKVADIIDNVRRAERRRRGLHIEAI